MSLSSEVKRALTDICTDTVFDEPMSRHTSFKIGGRRMRSQSRPKQKRLAKL